MASEAALQLIVTLNDQASAGLDHIGQQGSALQTGLGVFTGGLALQGVQALGGAISSFFGDAINESKQAAEGLGQLNAVLGSTKGAAGVTSQAAQDLSTSLSGVTRFTDDTVLAAESMLLTFTNIKSDVFPQVTETALNMAQAMGTDANGAAMQLGKALNDPIAGLSALHRVGVTFTEAQKEQITAMQKAGDTAGAQKVMLAELATEFGNSARAAGETMPGQLDILNNRLDNVKQTVGDAVMPIIASFLGMLTSPAVMGGIENLATGIATAIGGAATFFGQLWTQAQPVIQNVFGFFQAHSGEVIAALTGIGIALLASLVPGFVGAAVAAAGAALAMAPILIALAAVAGAAVLLKMAWDNNFLGIRDTVAAVWAMAQPIFTAIGTAVGTITAAFSTGGLGGALAALPGAFAGIWTAIQGFVSGALPLLGQFAQAFIAWIGPMIPVVLGQLGEFAGQVLGWLASVIPPIVGQLLQWAGAFIGWIAPMIPPALAALVQFAGQILAWLGAQLPILAGKLLEWAGAFIAWIAPMIPPALAALFNLWLSIESWLVTTLLAIVGKLGEWALAFVGWIAPMILPMLGALGGMLVQLGGWLIGTALPAIIGQLAQWGGAFIAWVGPQIPPLLAKLGELLAALGGWLINTALPAIISQLGQWAGAFLGWIATSVLPFLGDKLGEIWTAITTWIGNTASGILTAVADIGTNLVQGIWNGITRAWQGFLDFLHGLIMAIPEPIRKFLGMTSPSKVFADIGTGMVEGLGVGAEAAAPAVKAKFYDIASGMVESTNSGLTGMPGVFKIGFDSSITLAEAFKNMMVAIAGQISSAWEGMAQAVADAQYRAEHGATVGQTTVNYDDTGLGPRGGGRAPVPVATGYEGWITTPTLFLVGEGNEPEYLSATPKSKMTAALSGNVGYSGAGRPVIFNIGDIIINGGMMDGSSAALYARQLREKLSEELADLIRMEQGAAFA